MTTAAAVADNVASVEESSRETRPITEWEVERAATIYRKQLKHIRAITDRRFLWLMVAQWIGGIIVAAFVSPRAWEGAVSSTHIHLLAAAGLGGAIVALPILFAWLQPGEVWTRHTIAAGQMFYGALLIHLTGGRIETHFHVFGSLAFLAFYRDWKVLGTATLVVVIDHGWRALLWPASVFGVNSGSIFRVLEHGGWVIFEDFFLFLSIGLALSETRRLAADQARMESLNAEIAASKQESDTIMATVNQGLFLLGPNLEIGANYSNALRRIFGVDNLAHKDFLRLLKNIVPENTYHGAKDFLELMFNPAKREKQVAKVNPLSEIEVTLPKEDGGFETRHLEFRFNRVYDGKEITHLLAAVSDATDRFQLQQQLQATEERKERQLGMLLGVLHVEPAFLMEFIEGTGKALSEVNTLLRAGFLAESGTINVSTLAPKVDDIFRLIHGIKGNAAALQIGYFEAQAHAIEEKLQALKLKHEVCGEDFLPVVMLQGEMRADLDEVSGLLDRLSALKWRTPQEPAAAPRSVPSMLEQLRAFADETSRKLGKQADFICESLDETSIPPRYREMFRDIVIQLMRNALTHGIEPPSERVVAQKGTRGLIQVRGGEMNGKNGHFEFFVRDDGRGLQLNELRRQAVASGFVTSAEVQDWGPDELATLIFEPGFSTAAEVTSEAGRGYGMNLVKTKVVDEAGGEIRIESVPGRFCEFQITLPN